MSVSIEQIERFIAEGIKNQIDYIKNHVSPPVISSTTLPSSGFTPDTLAQAIEDAKSVRLQSLLNARDSLQEGFQEGFVKEIDCIDSSVSASIEAARPQIIKSEKSKPLTVVNSEDKIIAIHSYPPRTHSEAEKEKWKKILADIDKDTKSYIIDEEDWETDETDNDDDGNWAGTFQPKLKPSDLFFTVSLGNPQKDSRILLNCVENSRNELIYFKDNQDMVIQAIELFNSSYDNKTQMKTVLGGCKNDYINLSLTFDKLIYFNKEIHAVFGNHQIVVKHFETGTKSKINDYEKCIKDTCYFYLDGEVMLNAEENKIESMTINGLNYINPERMVKGEKFVYVA